MGLDIDLSVMQHVNNMLLLSISLPLYLQYVMLGLLKM